MGRDRIIFLNQMAGPLFRELAEDLAKVWPRSTLYTGHPDTICRDEGACLHIKTAPAYNRRNYFSRFVSWVHYFFKALGFVWSRPKNSILFIVSNPPFLGLAGLFFKWIRGQRYVVLVYDIYPDLLVALGRLRKGIISRCWDFFNRLVYENASLVMTIDEDMGRRLEEKFDVLKTDGKKIVCIPSWADIEFIRPVEKEQNPFATKYHLLNKTILLYSGNMGHTHDIETILEAARNLIKEEEIHFLFIGEGAKWSLVEKTIEEFHLDNITLLPFQPEEVLPLSMASGDIGIVAYQDGTQGCMSPSKACYYMAAGLPLLVISDCETDLTRLVEEKGCGIWVKTGNVSGMALAVKELSENPVLLAEYKKAARKTVEQFYSRKNTELFVNALKTIG
jgi:glycosyltransferase involved in cell wall biosynthesis